MGLDKLNEGEQHLVVSSNQKVFKWLFSVVDTQLEYCHTVKNDPEHSRLVCLIQHAC